MKKDAAAKKALNTYASKNMFFYCIHQTFQKSKKNIKMIENTKLGPF